jgi:competence protein ComEA
LTASTTSCTNRRSNSNSKSRRYLCWLVFGSSTYVVVRLRRLNPRRLDFILDLELDKLGTDTMRRFVMIVCAALLFVPVIMKSRTSQDIPAHTAFRALSSGRVSVKVSGDVLHPGIYTVPAKSLAASVINMAEPLRPLKQVIIDPATLPLLNGSAVMLAEQPDGSLLLKVDQMTVPERLVLGISLDIATMNEADFDRLPGIGPALARRIVEYSQNNGGILRVGDLTAVEGIGEKKYKLIRTYFQHP